MVDISENLSEFYYEKLKNESNPGKTVAEFYCKLHEINLTKKEIILFNKLVKDFGRFTAFFSALDSSKYDNIENPYPLLYTICKSRFEKAHTDITSASHINIDRDIRRLEEQVELLKNKKIKIPNMENM